MVETLKHLPHFATALLRPLLLPLLIKLRAIAELHHVAGITINQPAARALWQQHILVRLLQQLLRIQLQQIVP